MPEPLICYRFLLLESGMENHLTALDLSYRLDDGTDLFRGVSFTFGAERTGLIGENGVGKTTLLEVLSERKRPFSGRVIQGGRISYLAQTTSAQIDESVATAIGIGHVIVSLERIEAGLADSDELANADELWGLKERVAACFSRLGVPHISIYQ